MHVCMCVSVQEDVRVCACSHTFHNLMFHKRENEKTIELHHHISTLTHCLSCYVTHTLTHYSSSHITPSHTHPSLIITQEEVRDDFRATENGMSRDPIAPHLQLLPSLLYKVFTISP